MKNSLKILGNSVGIMLMLASLLVPCVPASLEDKNVIRVPYSSNIPHINGKWDTQTEWIDASETVLKDEYGWTAYLRMKHGIRNEIPYIFILVDFVTDQKTHCGDSVIVCFDTLSQGGNAPQVDDYAFHFNIYGESGIDTYHGTGTGWTRIGNPPMSSASIGFSCDKDPYESSRQHRIYEAQIQISFLGNKSSYGFIAVVIDTDTGKLFEFPEGAGSTYET